MRIKALLLKNVFRKPILFITFLSSLICFSSLCFATSFKPAPIECILDEAKEPVQNGFTIPRAQLLQARQQVRTDILKDTLFIIPKNDGEAARAIDILEALDAPHLQVSSQRWGATLDKEPLNLKPNSKIKRIVTFEMPSVVLEEKLRQQGYEVITIDHHAYSDLDRRTEKSSLEQLMELIKWPQSNTDLAIAVNDRSYIPGLKKMGLTPEQIRKVRENDLLNQGNTRTKILREVEEAKKLIPTLPKQNGVYILNNVAAEPSILKQELAIQSPDGLVSSLEIQYGKIGFSGNPKIAQRLLNFKFEDYGYEKGSFSQYGGGDPNASMFFGFKPKKPPQGEKDPIPQRVLDAILDIIKTEGSGISPAKSATTNKPITASKKPLVFSVPTAPIPREVRAAGTLPRGSALLTSSGNLEKQGIRHIIHAATGGMDNKGAAFEPNLKGVTDSIEHALQIAKTHNHKRIAIPFIGGKAFIDSIGIAPQALADEVVKAALQHQGDLEIRFVTFGETDTQFFRNSLKKFGANLSAQQASVTPGSITDFRVHGASAIVNAANMEVKFGGGVSGIIGDATGKRDQINAEAQAAIRDFYKQH